MREEQVDIYDEKYSVSDWLRDNGVFVLGAVCFFGFGYLVALFTAPSLSSIIRESGSGVTTSSNPATTVEPGVTPNQVLLLDRSQPLEMRLKAGKELIGNPGLAQFGPVYAAYLKESQSDLTDSLRVVLMGIPGWEKMVLAENTKVKHLQLERIRDSELLVGTKSTQSIDLLRRFTFDPDQDVRIAAYRALGACVVPKAYRILDSRRRIEEDPNAKAVLDNVLTDIASQQQIAEYILGHK